MSASISSTPTPTLRSLSSAVSAERGIRCALSEHWQYGGEGAIELAQAVIDACNEPEEPINFLYDLDTPLRQRVELIAKEVYGADGVEWSPLAIEKAERCMKKFPTHKEDCENLLNQLQPNR